MSQENVEVVEAGFQALDRSGMESVFNLLAEEIEWDVRADLPDSDVYRGHEGVRKLFATFTDVMEDIWFEPEEFIEVGDQVVVPLRWGGRGEGSGVRFEEREAWIFTVHAGKIVRIKEYPTKPEALEAAGLSE
jgi:ketosteroid isomerase-like protein